MTENKGDESSPDESRSSELLLYGAGFGVALGAGVGSAFGEVALGAGIGTAIGAAFGVFLSFVRSNGA